MNLIVQQCSSPNVLSPHNIAWAAVVVNNPRTEKPRFVYLSIQFAVLCGSSGIVLLTNDSRFMKVECGNMDIASFCVMRLMMAAVLGVSRCKQHVDYIEDVLE